MEKIIFEKIKTPHFALWIKNIKTGEYFGVRTRTQSIQLSLEETQICKKNDYTIEVLRNNEKYAEWRNSKNNYGKDLLRNPNTSDASTTFRIFNHYYNVDLLRQKIPLLDENGKEICILSLNDDWKFFITKINGKNAPFKLIYKKHFYRYKDDNWNKIIGMYANILWEKAKD